MGSDRSGLDRCEGKYVDGRGLLGHPIVQHIRSIRMLFDLQTRPHSDLAFITGHIAREGSLLASYNSTSTGSDSNSLFIFKFRSIAPL